MDLDLNTQFASLLATHGLKFVQWIWNIHNLTWLTDGCDGWGKDIGEHCKVENVKTTFMKMASTKVFCYNPNEIKLHMNQL